MTAGSKATRREVSTFWQRVERFERDNIEAARIILCEMVRYGGPDSGLCKWAALVLYRAGDRRREAA
jgi:hypothetical protein